MRCPLCDRELDHVDQLMPWFFFGTHWTLMRRGPDGGIERGVVCATCTPRIHIAPPAEDLDAIHDALEDLTSKPWLVTIDLPDDDDPGAP